MRYQVLSVGLKNDLLPHCREHFAKRNTELKNAINISEAVGFLKKEPALMLVLDIEYLRSIGQSDWVVNIRYVSFLPVIVLSDVPETDAGPVITAGADICYDNRQPPSVIALLLTALLRRYIEYDHYYRPETAPFQVGDIAIDPKRRLVWVRGKQIRLRPREFTLLLYFMQNPDIVLTAEQICDNAWKKDYLQGVAQSVHDLRQIIEPEPANPVYIKTVHRVGYRFTGFYTETCDN